MRVFRLYISSFPILKNTNADNNHRSTVIYFPALLADSTELGSAFNTRSDRVMHGEMRYWFLALPLSSYPNQRHIALHWLPRGHLDTHPPASGEYWRSSHFENAIVTGSKYVHIDVDVVRDSGRYT